MDKLHPLLLAAELDKFSNPWDKQAAAALCRLHAQRDALLEALKEIMSWEENDEMTWGPKARAAIKAAEEST